MSLPPAARPAPREPSRRRRRLADLAVLLAVATVAAAIFFNHLGRDPLQGDEGIHALVALSSAEGDWLPLRIGDEPYLGKPPLKVLGQAALFRAFGASELTARWIDAACGVGTVAVVWAFGAWVWGRAAGALAALLLAGTPQYLFRHGVREGVQDSALVLFTGLTLTLYFVAAERRRAGRPWRGWAGGAGAAGGAAILTKGAVALLAVAAAAVYEAIAALSPAGPRGGWRRRLAGIALLGGLTCAPFVPWLLYLHGVTDGRYLRHLRRDWVTRATESIDPGHVHGPAFYLDSLWRDFGPWLILGVLSLATFGGSGGPPGRSRSAAGRRAVAYLWVWAVVLVALPSLSVSKLWWYIYPAYPAIALLVGAGAAELARAALAVARRVLPGRRLVAAAAAVAAVALALAPPLVQRLRDAWTRTETPSEDLPVREFVRAYRKLDEARIFIRRSALVSPWNVYYLAPLDRPRWRPPDGFWDDDDGACRFVVRRRARAAPSEGAPAPRDLPAIPLTGWQREVEGYVIDVDGCLPHLARPLGELRGP